MIPCRFTWEMKVSNPERAAARKSAPCRSASDMVQLLEQVTALKDDNARLQKLVCELLWKSEELRQRIRELTE